jgi:hypothetical protein
VEQFSALMPKPCILCAQPTGRKFEETWVCDYCGLRQDEKNPEVIAITTRHITGRRHDWRPAVVYYIQFGDRIKIGTSRTLRNRLQSLPHDSLLAIEQGSYEREGERHRQFADTRIGLSEWFKTSPELEAHIRKLSAGVEDPWKQYNFWLERARPAA